MKKCRMCRKERPEEEYAKDRSKKDGLQSTCKDCQRERWRRYSRDPSRPYANYKLKRGDIDALREKQEGRCLGCGSVDDLCVDHDHSTGITRGLLCRGCNSALGLCHDNPTILDNLSAYLRSFIKD